MIKNKKGVSIISLVLCAVMVMFVVSAVAVATNNSAILRVREIARNQNNVEESLAYTRTYSKDQVMSVARQAFVNNYIELYDGKVDLEGFEALVIGEMMQTIPAEQLEEYNIIITEDGIYIE